MLVALLVTSCSGGGSDTAATSTVSTSIATTTTSDTGLGEGWGPERGGRRALVGFGEVAATVTAADGTTCEVCLMAATTSAQRARGLMEVTERDLGGYDGMLFEFDAETSGGFWMRNSPLPLSIAFFDVDGTFVSATDMAPCSDSASCPSYASEGPYASALEVPAGRLDELGVGDGSSIEVTAAVCPSADEAS